MSIIKIYSKNSNELNQFVIQSMVDNGIKEYTNENDVGKAWKSIFPNIKDKSIIGIKVNVVYPNGLNTHPEIVYSIIGGLRQMKFKNNNFSYQNIIIFDRHGDSYFVKAGYKINNQNIGVKCFGNKYMGYNDKIYSVGGVDITLCNILEKYCNYIINVPVVKDHSLAGVTLSMKNMYGIPKNPRDLHDNNCDPYIAELYALDPIYNKTKLIVMDSIFGIYDKGPGKGWSDKNFIHNSIYFSNDPVAIDNQLLNVINKERKKNKLKNITKAKHIDTAEKIGLGKKNCDIKEIKNNQ